MVAGTIGSPTRKWMNTSAPNGARKIRLPTFAVVLEHLSACSQST